MSQNGIRKHQFYYWQRQLQAQALEALHKDENHPNSADTLVEITQPELPVSQVSSIDRATTQETFGNTPVLT